MANFGDRLREVRREKGMTQAELARLTDRRQEVITNIERGKNKGLSESDVFLFARVLEVNPAWLYLGVGSKYAFTKEKRKQLEEMTKKEIEGMTKEELVDLLKEEQSSARVLLERIQKAIEDL